MYNLFIASLLLATTINANAQDVKIPAEAKSFIAAGFEPLDYITGDLNGDKKAHAILILKKPGEDSIFDTELFRPFIVLIRQADGKLKQAVRNDKAVMGRQSGGIFGDPYEGTQIFEKGFSLSFYGGSSWRWAYNYEFRWNTAKKNWFLAKESQSSFQAGNPEATMKNTEIDATELGEVPIDKFDREAGYGENKWKVKAPKTFFYDNPKLGSNPRKGLFIKGQYC